MADVHQCRDDVIVPAATEACFAVLRDIGTYARWWTLIDVTPVSGGTRLRPGVRFRTSGQRPGGEAVSWITRVTAVHAPVRIELEYDEGDLLGTTGWELETVPGGTRVAYVYYGVRPNSPTTERSFTRFGTRLHAIAMREDALAGLVRLFGGPGSELDDMAWRERVQTRVMAAIRLVTPG
jgi:uncharacterized protein YndB with AHSA1/START domain